MLPNHRVTVANVSCALSELMALAKSTGKSESIFNLIDPVILSVTVEFSGSGAIALMPLSPSIQVDFLAKSFHQKDELALGSITLSAMPKQLIYTPAIALPNGFEAVGANPEQAYFVSALVRVGATGFPSLIVGIIDGLIIQLYE